MGRCRLSLAKPRRSARRRPLECPIETCVESNRANAVRSIDLKNSVSGDCGGPPSAHGEGCFRSAAPGGRRIARTGSLARPARTLGPSPWRRAGPACRSPRTQARPPGIARHERAASVATWRPPEKADTAGPGAARNRQVVSAAFKNRGFGNLRGDVENRKFG
jgi:hypothetical protein